MKALVDGFRAIYRGDRKILFMMAALFLAAVWLAVLTVTSLRPEAVTVKVGYSDLGAYRDGKWYYMWVFAAFSAILGFGHNLVAVRVYEKKGASAAMLFLAMSIGIAVGTVLYLMKLLGEG